MHRRAGLWTTLAALALAALFGLVQVPVGGASSAPAASAPAAASASLLTPRATQSPIKHVIIAIYENHALDNVFSGFPGAFGDPPGGVPQPLSYDNVTGYNIPYTLGWGYGGNESSDVPDHDVEAIEGNEDNGSQDGFSYTDSNVSDGMFPSYIMPNSHGLAEEYGLADNYFHQFAGPTLPNRFYDYAITSGSVTSDDGPSNGSNEVYFNSLPRELEQYGLSWGDFDGNYNEENWTSCTFGPFPQCPSWYFTTTLSQLMPMLYFNWIQQYQGQLGHLQDYAALDSAITGGTLPAVSWYTPDWLCCTEHPGTIAGFGGNISQGEQSLLELVDDVETSAYWNSTAIFVTYDEGGGFFDHVPAPQMTTVGDGVRIPLLVISPYSIEGYVSHEYFTPASILHFVEWNWNLPPLGALDAQANLPLGFFNFSAAPRAALPASLLASSNDLTPYPWPLQTVSSAFVGHYTSSLVTHGNVTWGAETNNTVASSPALSPSGGVVYLSGMNGYLEAYNAFTGTELWSTFLGSASRSAPTVLPDGTIVVTTLRGLVAAYDPQGAQVWNATFRAPIYGSLALADGKLYGALQNGTAFQIDGNGSVGWERSISFAPIYATPVWDGADGLLLFDESSWGVAAVTTSGSVRWVTHIPGGVWSNGVVVHGTYYVAGSTYGLWPISLPSGSRGSAAWLNGTTDAPTVSGNDLYVGTHAQLLQAYALTPGGASLLWNTSLYGAIAAPALVQGPHLWVASEGGDLYEFAATGGAPLAVLQSRSSMFASPVLGDGAWIYFTAEDGGLYGLNESAELQLTVVPATATVSVSGVPITLSPSGTAAVLEPAGSYVVNASQVGYVAQSVPVTLTSGVTTPLSITLARTSVPPGTLAGTIAPSTATLTVNGTAVAIVSGAYSVAENPGPYALVASAPGYLTQWSNETAVAGSTTWWNISLQPSTGVASGYLQVLLSPSNALLTVSGNAYSQASGAFHLQENPGLYALEASAPGYLPSFTNATVASDQTTFWNATLLPVGTTGTSDGWLAGTVTNASTGAVLGGVSLNVAPGGHVITASATGGFNLTLAAGTYAVFVNVSGYHPFASLGIVVEVGRTTTIGVPLVPLSSSSSPGGSGSSSTSGLAGIPLLLWGLLIFLAVAAAIFVIVLWRKRGGPREGEPVAEAAEPGTWADPEAYAPPDAPPPGSAA